MYNLERARHMTDIIHFASAARGVDILKKTKYGYKYDVNLSSVDSSSLEKACKEGSVVMLNFATLARMFILADVYEALVASEEETSKTQMLAVFG